MARPAAGGPPGESRSDAAAGQDHARKALADPDQRGHRGLHPAGPGAPAVAAVPSRLPAGGDRVRRRALLRQRRQPDPRLPAVPLVPPGAAARDHPADGAVRAAVRGHRDGPRNGDRPDPDHPGQLGRRGPGGTAAPPPGAARGDRGLRDRRGLPGQRVHRPHRPGRAVAGAVLPARGPGPVRRESPDQQPEAPVLERRRVRFRGLHRGLGDLPRPRGPGHARCRS